MIRTTIVALALLTTPAFAQSAADTDAHPESNVRSYTPNEQPGTQRNGVSRTDTAGNQANANANADLCNQWNLKSTDLSECRRQYMAAKTDSDRQKIRARYEPNYNGNSSSGTSSSGTSSSGRSSSSTGQTQSGGASRSTGQGSTNYR